VTDVAAALVRAEALQAVTEERPQRFDRSTARRADDRLQFREAEFDRIEVGAVRRQIQQRGAGVRDRLADPADFVRTEVVRDDEIADVQGRDEDLFDVGEKARPVDRAVEDARCRETGHAERRDEGARLPAGKRRVVVDPGAPRRPPVSAQEIRGDAGLIEKDEVRRIPRRRPLAPVGAGRGDVRARVFAGAYRFFLP